MRRFLAAGGLTLLLLLGVVSWSLGLWTGAQPAAAATDSNGNPNPLTLKTRLEAGLKARLPSEFAFVAEVVDMVNNGTLPLSLVDSTFLWARKKPKNQFEYFQHGLTLRAAQIGVQM